VNDSGPGVDPDLPTVVVTAYTHDDDLRAVRREGILGLLPKPVPVRRLVELATAARRGGVVVVVEDDLALADNVCEALCQQGLAAVTAGSVLESDRLGDIKPFAALIDLHLPDGHEGQAKTRLLARFPGLPLVVMTGFAHGALPVPAAAIFEKPFDTTALVARMVELYQARHA
jgi:DNA-binding NtrC family response regulator